MVSTGVSRPAAVTVVLPLRTDSRESSPGTLLFLTDLAPILHFSYETSNDTTNLHQEIHAGCGHGGRIWDPR